MSRSTRKTKEKAPKKPHGRPSLYSTQLAALICERLTEGETLRSICRSEGMPSHSTVLDWARHNGAFSDQYARAREIGYRCMADELIEIADDDAADPARGRLRIDTRKWLLSKALPKIYGDKITLDATHHHDIAKISDEDIARELLNRGAEAGGGAPGGSGKLP